MIVNTELLGHPLNWLTIWLMVVIAAIVIHLIFSYLNGRNSAKENS